jgi:hypothetical protein
MLPPQAVGLLATVLSPQDTFVSWLHTLIAKTLALLTNSEGERHG